jgi:hypothetical protein
MDSPHFRTLRICPTTQQGGTQTIQQSIYLTHNNPCGANLLIFQEMGLTGIRYIDLKNYIDMILGSDEMVELFEEIRVAATEYINKPDVTQSNFQYLYKIQQWAQASLGNLPLPVNYYKNYRFRINVYDASGTLLYDSFYPNITILQINPTNNLYTLTGVRILPSNPYSNITRIGVYKISTNYQLVPFMDTSLPAQTNFISGSSIIFSNFATNQSGMPETVMAISSLLVDSANTRAFGIPKYGFSARANLSPFGGITYNCSHFVDIRTTPNESGQTTLVESIFFRLSLEEDTIGFFSPLLENLQDVPDEISKDFFKSYFENDLENMKDIVMSFTKLQKEKLEKSEKENLTETTEH